MPERVARNAAPSLLRSLMSDHLDPGYAAAARKRAHSHGRGRTQGGTSRGGVDSAVLVVGALLVGSVFGVAFAVATAPGADEAGLRSSTLDSVRAAEARTAELESSRLALADSVTAARTDALSGDGGGAAVVTELDSLEAAAAAVPVYGPGITVTVGEPPARTDLSDVSAPKRTRSDAVLLDRDLQVVVNSMWVSGAEAVSVGDIRVGPGVTIRQAGGAMLVDNRPVFSPYTVSAIGSPTTLQARFAISDAYLRMSALAQLYRVTFDVRAADALSMPAAVVRSTETAIEGGTR